MQKHITLKEDTMNRIALIQRLVDGKMTQRDITEELAVCEKKVRRLKAV
jgi:Trp operon repressor